MRWTCCSQHGDDAKVLAGGQSLVPLMSFRLAKPALLAGHQRVGWSWIPSKAVDGRLKIGALTRQCELLTRPLIADHCPLMRAATEFIGHPAIRNRGTVGGSVAHADPAAELPILLQVLDADIEVCSADSRRTIPAGDFFMGLLTTGMNPDELLTGISIPLPERGPGWGFHEVARRHGDFALVAAAALVTLDHRGAVAKAAVALGGIADRPLRVAAVEEALKGSCADPGSNRSRLAAGRRLGHAHGRHPRRRSLSRPSGTGSDQTCHMRRRGACPGFLIGKKFSNAATNTSLSPGADPLHTSWDEDVPEEGVLTEPGRRESSGGGGEPQRFSRAHISFPAFAGMMQRRGNDLLRESAPVSIPYSARRRGAPHPKGR